MTKRLGERIVERLRGFAETLQTSDNISTKYTCRTIRLNLHPQTYSAKQVRETRGLLNVSQAVFAQFLGVSVRAVQDWEQGVYAPNGVACRLMDEIRRDPGYWLGRLKELAEPVG
jgi:DNA-binding transcriptional regulator YiaG